MCVCVSRSRTGKSSSNNNYGWKGNNDDVLLLLNDVTFMVLGFYLCCRIFHMYVVRNWVPFPLLLPALLYPFHSSFQLLNSPFGNYSCELNFSRSKESSSSDGIMTQTGTSESLPPLYNPLLACLPVVEGFKVLKSFLCSCQRRRWHYNNENGEVSERENQTKISCSQRVD